MVISSTENIAKLATQAKYEQIPEEAVAIAKEAILDWLGVTIAATHEPARNITVDYVRQINAAGEASVICGDLRTSADLAAWVNGVASHALDYDDTFASSAGYNIHPTVAVLPAVLALGEKYHTSGREVITAYIVGIEVLYRIGAIIGEYNSKLGWHPTPVLGSIGAAAACARILNLNVVQVQTALGIASSLASGLRQNFGTMTKPLHAGNAARNGVVAVQLAKAGFTANEGILEGPFGFYDIFSGGRANDLEKDDQGDKWGIISTGITFKPYPCCRGTHSSIDATLHLRQKFGIREDNVAAIICKTSPMQPNILIYHRPRTGLEGKFSLEYCVATALLRGEVTLESFTDKAVADTGVQELLCRVSYSHPKEWPTGISLTQEVVVNLKNGTEYSHKVTVPKGDPENPMTDEELLDKFRDCAGLCLNQTTSEEIIGVVNNLESLEDISKLMEAISLSEH